MSTAAWEAIKAASDEIGWPANYKGDLEIDRQQLMGEWPTASAPTKFIYILRENGTHICRGISEAEQVVRVWKFADMHFYFWDGETLTKHANVAECAQHWIDSFNK